MSVSELARVDLKVRVGVDQIQDSQVMLQTQVSTPVRSVTHLTQENEFGLQQLNQAPREIWPPVFKPMRRRRLGSFSFSRLLQSHICLGERSEN